MGVSGNDEFPRYITYEALSYKAYIVREVYSPTVSFIFMAHYMLLFPSSQVNIARQSMLENRADSVSFLGRYGIIEIVGKFFGLPIETNSRRETEHV